MPALHHENLRILIPGMTHILERNDGDAVVYFEESGSAHMLLEDGQTRRGQWRLVDDGYIAEWDNGSTGRWTLEHEPGTLTYVNRDSGARVRMKAVHFGNLHDLPLQSA